MPARDGFQSDENPLQVVLKRFFRWSNTRLGWRPAALLIAFFMLWFTWDRVEKLPGVTWVLMKVVEVWKGFHKLTATNSQS